jgi:lysophospholipase L1-like esterase
VRDTILGPKNAIFGAGKKKQSEAIMRTALNILASAMMLAASLRAQTVPKQDQLRHATVDACANEPLLEKRLENMEVQLKDWPDLSRYADEDKQLAASPNEQRVVFMGDSITDGWRNPQFGGFFPGKPYVNRGIGGQTTPQMLLRFRADVIELKPKVVVILAGTNDIAGNTGPMTLAQTEANLATMSELAHAHGIRVVLSSVMPVNDVTSAEGKKLLQTTDRPPEKILALNAWIKTYAAEHGDTYLDYFSTMVDDNGHLRSDLTADGLHPQGKGYAVMAPLAEKAIAQALEQNP